jgi:hypothetical protein
MLLIRIERHLRTHKIAPARFGREVLGDPRFVFDLWAGREPRTPTIRKVLDYLENAERSPNTDNA